MRFRPLLLAPLLLFAACAGAPTRDLAAPPAAVPPPAAFATRLLAEHNRERARTGAPPLVWSERLARDAQGWASVLARSGVMRHSPAASRAGQGENLFEGTAGAYPLEEMIRLFIAEEKPDFRPGVFPAVARDGQWEHVGHYTQIIWQGSRELGCALATGHGQDFLVCRFAPAGNIVGQRVP